MKMLASTEFQDQEDKELPQCKIKRNYSCSHCLYFTQNPRFYLTHLRDVHGERITISNCSLCLYASRHYQKLVRHMKMVHGSAVEDIPGQVRKRPLIEEVSDEPVIPPLPSPIKWIIDIDNLSYDLKSSRKTLKDIAAIYFAENEIGPILATMEANDVVEVVPPRDGPYPIGVSSQTVFGDPKYVGNEDLEITCSCGHVTKCFLDLVIHKKSCLFQPNEKSSDGMPLDLSIKSLNLNDSSSDTNKFEGFKLTDEEKPENDLDFVKSQIFLKGDSRTSHKKVYKCLLCPFWASTASRFHVHIVGHQNKKPFKCSICGYCSNWRWDITKHIRLRTLRSVGHKNARVLTQRENDRVNYTKYDKYITLMEISEQDDDFVSKKCGEMLVNDEENKGDSLLDASFNEKNTKLKEQNGSSEKNQNQKALAKIVECSSPTKLSNPRSFLTLENGNDPFYKCKQCLFRHRNRDAVLVHVKINHQNLLKSLTISTKSENFVKKEVETMNQNGLNKPSDSLKVIAEEDNLDLDFTSKKNPNDSSTPVSSADKKEKRPTIFVNDRAACNENLAPFRCWHCHQVSNWKHVIQRHCRLKHSGLIRIETIDRSIDANNPTYRMLNLSSNSDDNKHDPKPVDKMRPIDKNANTSNEGEREISRKIQNITLKEYKKSRMNPSNLVTKKSQKPNKTPKAPLNSSGKLEKCNCCPFASSCHSAMKLHEQSHNPLLNPEDCQFSSSATKREEETINLNMSKEQQQIVVEKPDNNLPVSGKDDTIDSKIDFQMDRIDKEIQLKVKHSQTPSAPSMNSTTDNNYKKSPNPPIKSGHKTILVNPKTGQVIRRN